MSGFIELAELLSEWWFPLSTNPGRADQSKVGLHCMRGGIEAESQMKCPRTAGLGYTNKKSAVAGVAPFFLVENNLKDF